MIESLQRRRLLKTAFYGALSAGTLNSCGGNSNAAVPDSAAPVSQARIDTALGQLDTLARALMVSTGIPGMAVAVVQGDTPVFAKGYGVTQAGTQQAVDADTVFQLASMSKSLGSTVVARQVGKGIVDWDTPMHTLLPWFALSDPSVTQQLTVGDLYAHRSGLPDHVGDQLEDLGYDRTQGLERLRYVPLDGFRTQWHYTNFGMTAAAEGVATVSGIDWATLSEQALYQPLGMTRTSSRFSDFNARSNRAVGHVPKDGQFVPGPVRDPDAQSPAGGVSSSVNDVAKWMSMVLAMGRAGGTQLIPATALQPALSRQILSQPAHDDSPAGYYGFGFNVGTTDGGRAMVNHSGAFLLGAATFFMIVPSTNLGFVALTNAWPVGAPEALGLQFFDLVQYGSLSKDWPTDLKQKFASLTAPLGSLVGVAPPAAPAPAQPLSAYTGTYANDYYGALQVSEVNGSLVLTIGPHASEFPCTHWDGDVFSMAPYDESAPPGSVFKVTFSGSTATLEFFDDGTGLNVFTR